MEFGADSGVADPHYKAVAFQYDEMAGRKNGRGLRAHSLLTVAATLRVPKHGMYFYLNMGFICGYGLLLSKFDGRQLSCPSG